MSKDSNIKMIPILCWNNLKFSRHDCSLCARDGDDCHRVDEQRGDGLQQDWHQQGWGADQGGVFSQLSEGKWLTVSQDI